MNPTKIFVALTLLVANLSVAAGAVPLTHPRCSVNSKCGGGNVCCPLRGVVSTRSCDSWVGANYYIFSQTMEFVDCHPFARGCRIMPRFRTGGMCPVSLVRLKTSLDSLITSSIGIIELGGRVIKYVYVYCVCSDKGRLRFDTHLSLELQLV